MDYLYQYLLFLAQAVTLVIAVLLVIGAAASIGSRRQHAPAPGHLILEKLNDELDHQRDFLRGELLEKDALKALNKAEAKARKAEAKAEAKGDATFAAVAAEPSGSGTTGAAAVAERGAAAAETDATPEGDVDETLLAARAPGLATPLPGRPRLFVLDFDGDLQASRVDHLRREITALLTVASARDSVLVRLESPGGLVHAYGLAASQLARIRQRGLNLTVAVDKVAASGGYMMAAVAQQIIAAPFAVVGSVGVVAQVPNVHRLLKKNDVDVEVLTAGKFKRTLTVLGENTDEGREKFVEELEITHTLFQEHILQYRPVLDMDTVATGETWYGTRALDLKLIDEILTSDDYLVAACQTRDVYQLRWKLDRRPLERFLDNAQGQVQRVIDTVLRRFGGF